MGRASEWIRSVRGKFSATPGHAVVGFDQAREIRRAAQFIYDAAQAGRRRMDEEARKWRYDEKESYVCLAARLTDDRVSKRPYYEVKTVTEISGTGEHAFGRGWTIEDAETELRLQLAQIYCQHTLVRSFDEARERAAKVELHTERSLALGSR